MRRSASVAVPVRGFTAGAPLVAGTAAPLVAGTAAPEVAEGSMGENYPLERKTTRGRAGPQR